LKNRRKPRKNHDEERLSKLLEVPVYAEALDGPEPDDIETENTQSRTRRSRLITNRKQWRREFVKWTEVARDEVDQLELEGESNSTPQLPSASSTWLPRSLALLFGGKPTEDDTLDGYITRRRARRQDWSEEALRMELLVQEELDEIPDDGALEGSGDEYDGN
jgi:hypothetical protein